jgi:hypothetical protein
MILETHGLEKYGWGADRLKIHIPKERQRASQKTDLTLGVDFFLGESQSPRSPPADRDGCKRKKGQCSNRNPPHCNFPCLTHGLPSIESHYNPGTSRDYGADGTPIFISRE